MVAMTLLEEPILIGRTEGGKSFALRDLCPHRGMPLSEGRFNGEEVECAYHGWRFDSQGRCMAVPCLVDDQAIEPGKIKVRRYLCEEAQGNIWIFMGEGNGTQPAIPRILDIGEHHTQIGITMTFPCHVDYAALGLLDPAHGPFIHQSRLWRTPDDIRNKAKEFVPSELGFTMASHVASSNSRVYRLLGGEPHTEITFQLPGIRHEYIRVGKNLFVGMTVVTPVSKTETLVNHQMFWTMPWLNVFRPILRGLGHRFLNQDRQAMVKLSKGLVHDPPQMFVNDPDTQAKWYYQLKKEFASAQAEHRPFQNPIKAQTLYWRT